MKKTLLVLATLCLTSNITYSEEVEIERLEADKEYVMSLFMRCKDDATEDEVEDSDMTDYLLTCINDELDMSDYLPIKVLPKVINTPN